MLLLKFAPDELPKVAIDGDLNKEFDLRDRAGVTQVVFEEDVRPEVHEVAEKLRLEYCVGIRGKVVSRGSNVNPRLPTGEIEIRAREVQIQSSAQELPHS